MPTKTYTPLTTDQEGWGTSGSSNFVSGNYSDEIAQYRYLCCRFGAIDIPRGSTITSATLDIDISAKTPGDTGQYVTCDLYYDSIMGISAPLYLNEIVSSRAWSYTITSGSANNSNKTFNWTANGAARQVFSFDVRNTISTVTGSTNWPVAGYGAITFMLYCNSENGYLNAGWTNDKTPWRLTVNYTPPATSDLYIPNLLEFGNCNVPSTPVTSYQWESNTVLNAYSQATLDRVSLGSPGPTALPDGTTGLNLIRITAPTTGKTFVNYKAMELEAGVWYNFSIHVWVATGAPDWRIENMFRQDSNATLVTTKGAWVRQSINIMGRGRGQASFFGITTGAAATGAGQYLYIAQAMLTKTDYAMNNWHGGTTAGTGRSYGFTSGVSNTGIAVMTTRLPTATITSTMPDVSKTKSSPATTFTYSDPYSVSQGAFQIQRRRVS